MHSAESIMHRVEIDATWKSNPELSYQLVQALDDLSEQVTDRAYTHNRR